MRPPMLIALTLALALTAWVAISGGDDEAVEPVRPQATAGSAAGRREGPRSSAPAGASAKIDASQAALLVRSVAQWAARSPMPPPDNSSTGPWASQHPSEPPRVAAIDTAPPPPMAPAFPHEWVGRFNDQAERAIVTGANTTWVVAVGDVIESQWRVDQIGPRQLGLTYLPLQQRVSVAMKAP